jgi:hypothetical protein
MWGSSFGAVLLLDERIKPDGVHVRTWATSHGEQVLIHDEDGSSGELSLAAVDHVMCRYGRPLDEDVALEGDCLVCGTYRLRRLRHHALIDAEARDYLVWERPGDEPVVCVAATVTAAMRFLVSRMPSRTTSRI